MQRFRPEPEALFFYGLFYQFAYLATSPYATVTLVA